jgi:hypothetical protein
MPGLVPGIHVFLPAHLEDVDGRDKPGHDERKKVIPAPETALILSVRLIGERRF